MSVSLLPSAVLMRIFGNGGLPLNAGNLYTYATGTTTPQATYTTSAGNVQNANPIVLDATGQPPAEIWLTDGTAYTFTLKDSLGNTIVTQDNISAPFSSAVLTASSGSASIGFLQAGSGAVATTLQTKSRQILSVFDFMSAAQIADVQAGTALQNVAAALTLAIAYANTIGAILYFPPGIYLIGTTTLVFKNKVRYIGSGNDSANTLGTLIKYTGTSDAAQVNNPINSSTAANYAVEDMRFLCTTRTAGKASFADVGSTFVTFRNVGFSGNDYGLILDQTEEWTIDDCDLELTSGSSTGGIWLVNGADHTPGASAQFTNRGTIRNCQFNGTVGIGIVDDGGVCHHFHDNNFNGLAKHIRVAQVNGIAIDGENECEGSTTTSIHFAATKLSGTAVAGTTSASVRDNMFSSSDAINLITYDSGALLNQILEANTFINNNVGGSPTTGLSNVPRHSGAANNQQGTGTATNAALGNYQTGTSTNDNAPTGAIGEIVSSTNSGGGSAVSLSNNTAANVTSISLTAGDWDVSGNIVFNFNAATSYTILQGSVSTSTGAMGSTDTQFTFETPAAVPGGNLDTKWPLPVSRLSLNATTTVYLVALGVFTVNTLKAYGTIRARRVR